MQTFDNKYSDFKQPPTKKAHHMVRFFISMRNDYLIPIFSRISAGIPALFTLMLSVFNSTYAAET
jgi:hypothetical protein